MDRESETTNWSAIVSGDVKWIVNDIGELGVEIHGRLFFLHKGESLEYGGKAFHDEDDKAMQYRRVGKREFGETVWPQDWIVAGRRKNRYTVDVVLPHPIEGPQSDDSEWQWRDMPLPAMTVEESGAYRKRLYS